MAEHVPAVPAGECRGVKAGAAVFSNMCLLLWLFKRPSTQEAICIGMLMVLSLLIFMLELPLSSWSDCWEIQVVQRTLVSALCLLVQHVTATLTSLLPKSIFQPVFISQFALGGQPWCFWGSVALGSAAGALQGRAGWDGWLSPQGGCFWTPEGYPSLCDFRKVLESQISK